MTPIFPQFKKLELSDRGLIESFTKQYPPYSDYNFTSLWSWDTQGQVEFSVFNNNLIIQFTDYLTAEPFYSFLGIQDREETIELLLSFVKSEGGKPFLKLLPEESVRGITSHTYSIEEDRDNFDYIYSTNDLVIMSGGKLRIKRKHINYFQKNFPHELKFLDLSDPQIRNEIINIFHVWAEDKGKELSLDYARQEFYAILRFLEIASHTDHFALGVVSNKRLIAFAAVEIISNDYGLSHFQKAINGDHKGLNDYLTREVAKVLVEKKIKWLNCEQDLGVPGLRESKTSYRPNMYLKKFSIHAL